MENQPASRIQEVVGDIPFRLALAGGWIDQPFCSRLNPTPPGSMVVVSVQPTFHWMERAGIAGHVAEAVRTELENCDFGRFAPSASQGKQMQESLERIRKLRKLISRERVRPARRAAG